MTLEKVLIITPEELKAIKNTYGRTDKQIQEDVEHIKEWLQKQPHLPQDEDELRIRRMLALNKFSLEKTKNKIDMYYSLKNLAPDIYENREPLHPEIKKQLDNLIIMPLPNLTKELHRVYIFRFIDEDTTKFSINTYLKIVFATFDIRLMYDPCLGDHFVLDFEHAKLGHFIQFTPIVIKHAYDLLQKAYSDRLKGVHFINLPPAGNTVVAVINAVLSTKLAQRVHVHKSLEELHKFVDKNVLPVEYGGEVGKLQNVFDDWREFFESRNSWLIEIGEKKSDESRRIGKPLNSDMFGVDGSFRKLNLD